MQALYLPERALSCIADFLRRDMTTTLFRRTLEERGMWYTGTLSALVHEARADLLGAAQSCQRALQLRRDKSISARCLVRKSFVSSIDVVALARGVVLVSMPIERGVLYTLGEPWFTQDSMAYALLDLSHSAPRPIIVPHCPQALANCLHRATRHADSRSFVLVGGAAGSLMAMIGNDEVCLVQPETMAIVRRVVIADLARSSPRWVMALPGETGHIYAIGGSRWDLASNCVVRICLETGKVFSRELDDYERGAVAMPVARDAWLLNLENDNLCIRKFIDPEAPVDQDTMGRSCVSAKGNSPCGASASFHQAEFMAALRARMGGKVMLGYSCMLGSDRILFFDYATISFVLAALDRSSGYTLRLLDVHQDRSHISQGLRAETPAGIYPSAISQGSGLHNNGRLIELVADKLVVRHVGAEVCSWRQEPCAAFGVVYAQICRQKEARVGRARMR